MSIKVTINPAPAGPSVKVKQNKQTATVLNFVPQPTISTLSQISQIDTSGAEDGATMVYDAATDKYLIEILPNVKGGIF